MEKSKIESEIKYLIQRQNELEKIKSNSSYVNVQILKAIDEIQVKISNKKKLLKELSKNKNRELRKTW